MHRQAEQHVRQLLRRPEFHEGRLLPDELTLANQLGISRGTVRAALTRLVQEGLLDRRAGVGTRVRPRRAEGGISAWRSFTREMEARGIAVETYFCRARRGPAPKSAAQALRIAAGESVLRLDRVRGWDGRPVLHSRSWFHPRLAFRGDEDFSQPLYEVIERTTGVVADHAREAFAAVPAVAALAGPLQVAAGEPLLMRRHTVFDAGDRPLEIAEVHYVSRRFQLTLDLRREAP